jgi:ubiquitination network signaling protein AcrB
MPPRKKSAAHERSNNSQGLAAPSRRIAKQKSNGQLNGQPQQSNGHPKPPTPPAASAQAIIEPTLGSAPPSDARLVNGTSADAKMGVSHSHPNGRPRMSSGASDDDLEAHAAGQRTPGCTSPLRIDLKSAHRHHRSTFMLAKTVLSACPLADVLALLIILLQLPPTIISVVHFLFVALTFVTPATTTFSNLPSVNEILLGSGGVPSLPVIISLDVIALVFFFMTTVPMQNIGLDIAQAVIAISLGGAAASKGGTTKSVAWCITIITLSHLFRWRPARQIGVSLLWSGLIKTGFQPVSDPPSLSESSTRLQIRPGWARSVLGVHILMQALVRMVRRYLLWRDAESPSTPTLKKADPEAGTGSALNMPRVTVAQFESATDSASTVSTSTDGRPPGPSPAPRDGKERSSSSRKKRRQATQVRSQQPFWAALASTKVTFVKELEQSQAAIDAIEASSADLAHVGCADFTSWGERVWIRDIGSSEILFGLTLPTPLVDGTPQEDESDSEAAVVSKTRPFYVRLNGAGWSSVKIEDVWHKRTSSDDDVDVWYGKIFGLTAYSPYDIEFVRLGDDTPIYAASLITLSAPSTEQSRLLFNVVKMLPETHMSH